ncbi:5-formyl-3-hydroxy-2-methylpyridine 4-carboxylate 5-dehydrogenase [Nitratireductor basaltis]|uniref:5-formyl-3-hydroxy-2-methylpyridine-4-carboxylic acid dehydrogenase n=1 Tax=Nitratireductor basaltis TaxID=472175 RepID=A0A084U7S1_9HYPH|nr:5-formyl-3-hydroxy-2-methylpyridine 4-carboxylate 5-dehydrogenase [Nitratireductor basaltis]KFB09007.1 5-formyl-3-hydroxy-2-methylpyridine-4-carboxylic acid dehydrogenase [Nitratireductor basaltis]
MIKRTAIIGLGTMGPGMAARLARGGVEVVAYDIAPAAIERARGMLGAAEGVLDSLEIDGTGKGGSVRLTDVLEEAVAGADLVIENVPEKEEIKAEVYRSIEGLISADTIVASDTSGIPITKLQAHISNPARMVGMHWSNPPHIIPMIEVIGGEATSPETVQTIRDFIRSLGLLPVLLKKDVPGFVENRVLYALLREVVDLVERGVIEPEDIDTCVSWGIGYKLAVVGPMALLDMAGMDIYHSVSSFLNEDLCDRKDVAPLVQEQIAAGKLGIKSGAGLYSYTPESIARLQPERARKLVAIRRILEGKDQ